MAVSLLALASGARMTAVEAGLADASRLPTRRLAAAADEIFPPFRVARNSAPFELLELSSWRSI